MEMNGRLIFKCEKSDIEQCNDSIDTYCDIDDSSYKKGIVIFYISGGSDLQSDVEQAIAALSSNITSPMLAWIEGDEDPSITLLSYTAGSILECQQLDGGLFEYLEELIEDSEEEGEECELSEEHQLAVKLGPKKYFTQCYDAWIAPYKTDIAKKEFKESLEALIDSAD